MAKGIQHYTKWAKYQSETAGKIHLSSESSFWFWCLGSMFPSPTYEFWIILEANTHSWQSLSLSVVLVKDWVVLERGMCFIWYIFFSNPCWLCVLFIPCRAITLDNHLVVLATTAADAGRYHVEAVNEMTGENVTSPAVYLSISGKEKHSLWGWRIGCEIKQGLLCEQHVKHQTAIQPGRSHASILG